MEVRLDEGAVKERETQGGRDGQEVFEWPATTPKLLGCWPDLSGGRQSPKLGKTLAIQVRAPHLQTTEGE